MEVKTFTTAKTNATPRPLVAARITRRGSHHSSRRAATTQLPSATLELPSNYPPHIKAEGRTHNTHNTQNYPQNPQNASLLKVGGV